MPKLSKDWITESIIDFEYKKYLLLAYLQEVEKNFETTQLYPSLSELVNHYLTTKALRENKEQLQQSFPQRLSGLDSEKMNLKYEKVLADDEIMKEVASIIEYSIPRFEKYLQEGKKIYDFVEGHIHFSEVGLLPLHTGQGYFLLKGGEGSATNVFEYQLTFYETSEDRFRAIRTRYVRSYTSGFLNSFNNIKAELLKDNPELPNPATFALESDLSLPIAETFLPVAKRILVKKISPQATA